MKALFVILCATLISGCGFNKNYSVNNITNEYKNNKHAIVALGVDLSESNLDQIGVDAFLNGKRICRRIAHTNNAQRSNYTIGFCGNERFVSACVDLDENNHGYILWEIPLDGTKDSKLGSNDFLVYLSFMNFHILNKDKSKFFSRSQKGYPDMNGDKPILFTSSAQCRNSYDTNLVINQNYRSEFGKRKSILSSKIDDTSLSYHIQKKSYDHFMGCRTKVSEAVIYYLGELKVYGDATVIVSEESAKKIGFNMDGTSYFKSKTYTDPVAVKTYDDATELANNYPNKELYLHGHFNILAKFQSNPTMFKKFLAKNNGIEGDFENINSTCSLLSYDEEYNKFIL